MCSYRLIAGKEEFCVAATFPSLNMGLMLEPILSTI